LQSKNDVVPCIQVNFRGVVFDRENGVQSQSFARFICSFNLRVTLQIGFGKDVGMHLCLLFRRKLHLSLKHFKKKTSISSAVFSPQLSGVKGNGLEAERWKREERVAIADLKKNYEIERWKSSSVCNGLNGN
jgi:hypothetical protein